MKKKWHEYLWIAEILYWVLGLCNILFAWLGLAFFVIPLMVAIFGGSKAYCNRYCGRGQLFELLGGKLKLSFNHKPPKFLRSKWFRYGFLAFFMTMFGLMLWGTYKVFTGAPLKQTVTLLWTIKLPWQWADVSMVAPWFAQFAFGFFGVMMTSTVLGLLTMVFFRPRSWCVYCPMGTMTQGLCQLKNRGRRTAVEAKARKIAGLLKILANEHRLLILCALIENPLTVGEIHNFTPDITQSALSQHLSKLEMTGILTSEKHGMNVVYQIADNSVIDLINFLKANYCR